MSTDENTIHITSKQARVMKLLYKFRFVHIAPLAKIVEVRHETMHYLLEKLVEKDLVIKVYEDKWRIDRKPAQYYLNKRGVTAVRRIMDVKESVVHALYKNDTATDTFKEHCLTVLNGYVPLKQQLPPDTAILAKAELSRFREFPKTRPDLYIRTPDNREAMIIFVHDTQPRIIKQRLEEMITHFDEDEWPRAYPTVAFILKDVRPKNAFLFKTKDRLENMGVDESELTILATNLDSLKLTNQKIWSNAFEPLKAVNLF